MKKKVALVTAGPTHEAIDPVRFIGNRSTGKMGFCIAQELTKNGFDVVLISGPTSLEIPKNVTFVSIQSAQEMYNACLEYYSTCDLVVFSAAVADYTPKEVSTLKIKKNEETFSIDLVKTKDIAKELGLLKKQQIHVGFALETNNEEENAQKKLKSKNLDFIVLNSLKNEGTCFGSDNNKITILEQNNRLEFGIKSKEEVAKDIVNHILEKF